MIVHRSEPGSLVSSLRSGERSSKTAFVHKATAVAAESSIVHVYRQVEESDPGSKPALSVMLGFSAHRAVASRSPRNREQ